MTKTNSERAHDRWRAAAPKPAPQTDAAWRASVERDARAAGCSPQVAAYLADRVGRPPTQAELDRLPKRVQALFGVDMKHARPPAGRCALTDICTLYGAQSLVSEICAAQLPLLTVAALLREACGGNALTPAGIAQVHLHLQARHFYGGQLA